jgi:hypothetical protein
MSLAINSQNTFHVAIPHGYVQGNTNSSVSQSLGNAGLVLEGVVSNRNEYSKELALNNALYTFFNKTRTLHQSLNSYDLPTGDLPRLFRTASVSDSDKVSAQATSGATSTSYLLDIDRLATAKTNRSKTLASIETTDLDEGTYTFTLTVGDTTHSLSIYVDKSYPEPDTNKDVLRKLASKIGIADDTIEAFVTETDRKVYSILTDDMSEKVVYLTVRSKTTGDAIDFSFSDDTGAIIDTLDINNLVLSGQTSQYRLNNTLSTADTNTDSVDNGHLTMNFLDTTAVDPVTITVKGGLKPVRDKLFDLISSYNDYVSWLDQNSRYIKSAVKTGIINEIDPVSRNLRSIGMQFNANGTVNLTDEFTATLQADKEAIREALTGENGFFTKVEARLSKILENGVQAYHVDQSQSSIYNQHGIADTLFANYQTTNRLSLFA